MVSPIKHKDQRVVVLMDVQNLYHSARNLYKKKVNFKRVLERAVSGRRLVRAFAYVVRTKSGEEKPFFEALTKLGIETRVRDLQEFYGGQKKADWDVGIVVDAIRTSNNADTVVLCSGDGDFISLVEYLKSRGKRVEVLAFEKTTSSELTKVVDEFFDISPKRFLLSK